MVETTNRSKTELGMRIFAILAFIIILIVGIWASVYVARMVPNAFSNLASAIAGLTSIFVPANETITLSTPLEKVSNGETFLLSWAHANKKVEGSYTFRYNCAEGVSLTSPNASGVETTVFCDTPFNFLNAHDAIILTAASNKNQLTEVALAIDFTPRDVETPTITGAATLAITNESVSETPATPSSPTSVTPVTPVTPIITTPTPTPRAPTAGTETSSIFPIAAGTAVSNPNGSVDLTGYIIEVGIVDKTTNVFTASSIPMRNPEGARLAIRFAVENAGTKRSSMFDFNAVLPTFPGHIFTSPMQQELGPGDRIEFTLAFDSFVVNSNEGIFVLNIDPSSRIMEPNKNNNIVKYTMHVQ